MNTVKIYKITCTKAYQMSRTGEFWNFGPWLGNDIENEGYDDGGHEYVIPDGYSLGETVYGETMFFKDGSTYGLPLTGLNQCPAIAFGDKRIPLARAD